MRFQPAGDLALLIELDPPIDAVLSRRLRALEACAVNEVAGIVETVPSFCALLVYYDPRIVGYEALCAQLAARVPPAEPVAQLPSRLIELPCCYRDPELGADLAAVGARLGIAIDALIGLHTSVEYLVYFIGFAPGQPYLIGMPAPLTIPRLETPRTRTPPGSVGIGGTQSCVYSVESPGGFWVLGRTPVPLYDPTAAQPVLLQPGDRLRFVEIDRGAYECIAAAVAARTYRVAIA